MVLFSRCSYRQFFKRCNLPNAETTVNYKTEVILPAL